MGGFQDWIHLFYLYMAKVAKRPLAYYGRSFGPFPTQTWSNRRFKKLSLNILRYFSYCSVRDKKTQELANKLGIPYEPTIDSAFLDSPKINLPYEIDSIVSSPYVVFVPNLLIWHYAYNNVNKEQVLVFFSKIYEEIVKAYPQYNVLMLPQTFNFGNYLNDDRLFFLDLKKRIGSPNLYVLSDKYLIQDKFINIEAFKKMINELSFEDFIEYDKRSFCRYYVNILFYSHIILSVFFRFGDYNLFTVKLGLFFMTFPINLTMNIFFFTNESITLDYLKSTDDISAFWRHIDNFIFRSRNTFSC